MILTFGQYNTLSATRQCISRSQLLSQTEFDRIMVTYYLAVLRKEGLIVASNDDDTDETYYQLTNDGISCLEDYEQHNPALVMRQLVYEF